MVANNQYIYMKKVISYLNYAKVDSRLLNKIRELILKIENEAEFYSVVQKNSVHVLVFTRLNKYFKNIVKNSATFNKMNDISKKNQDRFFQQSLWIQKILKKTSDQEIKLVFLKGYCFSRCIYDEQNYKKMNDIDILIEFKNLEKIKKVLIELNFFCLIDSLFVTTTNSTKTYHCPPFISGDFSCVISLHWGLSHKINDQKILQNIWQRVEPIAINEFTSYRMSWEDNLLHLCIHLPFYKLGIREFADIFNIIHFCMLDSDIEQFKFRIAEWNAHEAVYRAFELTRSAFEELQSNNFVNQVIIYTKKYSSYSVIRDTEKRMSTFEFLIKSRSTYISKIEKKFLLFRITDSYKLKVILWFRLWFLLFIVPSGEVRKFSCYIGDNQIKLFLYRLKTPLLILNSLCRDHGTNTIIKFTLFNFYIIIKETVKLKFLFKSKIKQNELLFSLYKELE